MVGRWVAAALMLASAAACSSPASDGATPSSTSTTSTTMAGASTPPTMPPDSPVTEPSFPEDLGDPDAVAVPAPEDGTGAYLAGDGAVAVAFVAATEPLARSAAVCAEVGVELDVVGAPSVVLDAIGQIPDAPTRDIFSGLWVAASRAIAECNVGDLTEERRTELAWHWRLADRRLDAVGVAR